MCGIAGLIQFNPGKASHALSSSALAMAAAIAHRGPDADGVWNDPACGIALAHRRLSIIDLSPAGAQPMVSHSARFVIVFNGEIYNYKELKANLPQSIWRGQSDTEVLLEAIETWGIDAALRRCVGMYAFALWDTHNKELFLARDRFGEKPLYYGCVGNALLFGSELKALKAYNSWTGEIDRIALDDFVRHGVVHAPRSIYSNVKKLPAASFLRIPFREAAQACGLIPERYWSLEEIATTPQLVLSDGDATRQLEFLLSQAVAGQMVADVPVGAFLSGGIDSSVIVALMQAQSRRSVNTFSIGFDEPSYNEADYAAEVAAHLGTTHTELIVTSEDARSVIPKLSKIFDEPFADSSQIPTYLVAKLARAQVTVGLSGDGGDELFGGYNRYFWAQKYWAPMQLVPKFARKGCVSGVHALAPNTWNRLWKMLPRSAQLVQPGDKLYKFAELLAASTPQQAYSWLTAQHRELTSLVVGDLQPLQLESHKLWGSTRKALAEKMMLADALEYLPDDILVKVDRAAMAVSLETRAPFLDHRLAEFAFRLPVHQKIRSGVGKWLLREVLYRRVPKSMMDRPKMGFGVPLDAWLRGPLRQWAEDLLSPDKLEREGFFVVAPIQKALREHLSGSRNNQHFLWNILMFESWLYETRKS